MKDAVKVMDAVTRYAHNVGLEEFQVDMWEGHSEVYAREYFRLMQKDLTRFWAKLDLSNQREFIKVALARQARLASTDHDDAEQAVKQAMEEGE